MFGIEDVPLLSHAMIAEVNALADGHIALGAGQVNSERFTMFAANPSIAVREALESRFKM